ncbi:MAG: winged helix-turn-helix transcriptional regulator [Spirochaetota bacterium]|jgi:DNA-binding MarR family transcriptional regulator|uniref:winged helix-turn-helix transcriptional regulator n=1 Tax=Gracilinema caldarium TaxID=215591 RepID=UPI0026F0A525|nr:winged helix-turn-helix transcriptional regulator [Gracilinema caldarium]
MNTNEYIDPELAILETIYDSSRQSNSVKQRDLATTTGTSLGMTNAILKRLTQKGWITIKKLNSRNIQYAITPDGINEIARRSYRYFKRTIRNVVMYRDGIDAAINKAKIRGYKSVVLIGISDLDFIVEHSCLRHGLTFLKSIDLQTAQPLFSKDYFFIFSESFDNQEEINIPNSLFLFTLLSAPGEFNE